MDYANRLEAIKEALWDVEGADMVMVKPGTYLDIVREVVKNAVHVPVTVCNVRQYAMIKAASKRLVGSTKP
jgi:porphobilinogen synthase